MKYKGFEGVVTFDEDANILHGEVINTRDVITFQGRTVEEVKKAFRESIDDYLDFCRERGERPEKPFSGTLVIRINRELHRDLTIDAKKRRVSLNTLIQERLADGVALIEKKAHKKRLKAREKIFQTVRPSSIQQSSEEILRELRQGRN